MRAQAGDRVRIKHRYAYGEGDGQWGTVEERTGRKWILVRYDGAKRRTSEHDAYVVEVIRPETATNEEKKR